MKLANENFKKVRKQLRYKQIDFDEILDLSKQRSSSIENERSNVDDEILKKLRDKFNINPMFVLFGEGEMFLKPENVTNEESSEKTEKKIINGDNNKISINSGSHFKNYENATISKNILNNNQNNKISELINMYEHIPPIEQEIIYHELKLRYLKAQI